MTHWNERDISILNGHGEVRAERRTLLFGGFNCTGTLASSGAQASRCLLAGMLGPMIFQSGFPYGAGWTRTAWTTVRLSYSLTDGSHSPLQVMSVIVSASVPFTISSGPSVAGS